MLFGESRTADRLFSSVCCATFAHRLNHISTAALDVFVCCNKKHHYNNYTGYMNGQNWTHDPKLRLGQVTLQTFLNFTRLFLAWVFLGHSLPYSIYCQKIIDILLKSSTKPATHTGLPFPFVFHRQGYFTCKTCPITFY